jgi:hypothetical protein
MSEPHPLWGKSLDQYTSSHASENAQSRLAEQFIMGNSVLGHIKDAIGRICRKEEVSMDMLKYVLLLTRSPNTIRMLNNPPMISGCIKLFSDVKSLDQPCVSLQILVFTWILSSIPQPFAFEYGYLCFKIIAVSLGVAILGKLALLDNAILCMFETPHTPLVTLLSSHVARAIEAEIYDARGSNACDWALGWADRPGKDRNYPLVLRADLLTLLSTMWEDRRNFLVACISNRMPGLSSVVFLLWRFVHLER